MSGELLKRAMRYFGIDLKRVNVRIYPQNAGAPVFESEGGVASVVRSAAGEFTITLTSSYFKFRTGQATYRDERANVDLIPQLGPVLNEGTPVATAILVRLKTGTVSTDTPAGAGAKDRCIYVDIEFEDLAA